MFRFHDLSTRWRGKIYSKLHRLIILILKIWGMPKKGVPLNSCILIGVSIINHSFWGCTPCVYIYIIIIIIIIIVIIIILLIVILYIYISYYDIFILYDIYIYVYIYMYMCVCWYYLYSSILHPCVFVWLSSIRSISSGDKKAQLAAELVAKLDANDAGTSEFLARGSGAEVAPIRKISGDGVRYIQYNVAMCIHAYMTSTYIYIIIY